MLFAPTFCLIRSKSQNWEHGFAKPRNIKAFLQGRSNFRLNQGGLGFPLTARLTFESNQSVYKLFCLFIYFQSSLIRNLRLSESLRKNQLWNGIISITLLEGKNVSGGNMTEMFVQLKLGDQRYKSKVSFVKKTRRILSFQVIKIKVPP